MAEIVVGVACSHSPQLSTPVATWREHAARDRSNPELLGTDGQIHSFDELVPMAPRGIGDELTDDVFVAKNERMQAGIRECKQILHDSGATVAVIFGNDHKEMFGDDGMPAFAVYRGETVPDKPVPTARMKILPDVLRAAQWAYHDREKTVDYPVQSDLAWLITEHLMEVGFDPSQMTEQPPGRTLGHAWTYARRQLMGSVPLPMVPIALNSLYPPNQPSPARCFAFGRAVGDAVAAWESDERVAVITTGGLSHFVVDQELDRTVLDAITSHDETTLAGLDRRKLNSGNSEILNWITAAGALTQLQMKVVDYVPAYRSEAGTGVGMGFVAWQ